MIGISVQKHEKHVHLIGVFVPTNAWTLQERGAGDPSPSGVVVSVILTATSYNNQINSLTSCVGPLPLLVSSPRFAQTPYSDDLISPPTC